MKIYDPGDVARFHATFVASGGGLVDPASVYFFVMSPNGSVSTYGYPASMVRTATGAYYVDILASQPGDFAYRFRGAPSIGAAAAESVFAVRSRFVL